MQHKQLPVKLKTIWQAFSLHYQDEIFLEWSEKLFKRQIMIAIGANVSIIETETMTDKAVKNSSVERSNLWTSSDFSFEVESSSGMERSYSSLTSEKGNFYLCYEKLTSNEGIFFGTDILLAKTTFLKCFRMCCDSIKTME